MYKSCSVCGRVHRVGKRCPYKKYKRRDSKDEDCFRSSAAWKRKREQIKQRDLYLCRMCLAQSEGLSRNKINVDNLSVHHIEPLHENWERRLDDENLITLCPRHHEMAECGHIKRDYLHALAHMNAIECFDKKSGE